MYYTVDMKRSILIFSFITLFFISVNFTHASGISLGIINPNWNVPFGTSIYFKINTPELFNTYYTLSDTFPQSTLSNSNINTRGEFTWTPSLQDIGTHTITIRVGDPYGRTETITQTLIIGPASPLTIHSISPGTTATPNNIFSLIVTANGFSNASFSVTDSFVGSSITRNAINSSGILIWTPTTSDVGIHNLRIQVDGAGGRTASIYQTVTVKGISIQDISRSSVPVGTPLTFTIKNHGLGTPTYTVSDSVRYNTISQSTINNDRFSWTPQVQDIGSHTISVETTDGNGDTFTAKVTITVTSLYETPTTPQPTPITPTTDTRFIFNKPLDIGSLGNDVRELQKRLTAEGFFTVSPTGYYGPVTKIAVQAFQKKHGLSPLGNVGPGTRAALNKR